MLRKLSIIMVVIGVVLCAIAGISVYTNPAIENLYLNYESKELTINTYFDLEIDVEPSKARFSEYSVKWESSNTNIATVKGGRVTAVNVGEAVITATYYTHKLECRVTVLPVYLTDIQLSYSYLSIHPNETLQITSTIVPSNATYPEVSWTSSNPQVATVNSSGLVSGLSVGTTTITASGSNNISKSVEVEVKDQIEVESISINLGTSSPTQLTYSASSKLATCEFYPANADNASIVSWESSNPSVISINQEGYYKVHTHGSATITATSANGKVATYYLNVPRVEANWFAINNPDGTDKFGNYTLEVGESFKLSLDILKAETISSTTGGMTHFKFTEATTRDVTYTSSSPSKVSVDENGVVTALESTATQYGNLGVTITVKLNGVSSTLTDTITIIVP